MAREQTLNRLGEDEATFEAKRQMRAAKFGMNQQSSNVVSGTKRRRMSQNYSDSSITHSKPSRGRKRNRTSTAAHTSVHDGLQQSPTAQVPRKLHKSAPEVVNPPSRYGPITSDFIINEHKATRRIVHGLLRRELKPLNDRVKAVEDNFALVMPIAQESTKEQDTHYYLHGKYPARNLETLYINIRLFLYDFSTHEIIWTGNDNFRAILNQTITKMMSNMEDMFFKKLEDDFHLDADMPYERKKIILAILKDGSSITDPTERDYTIWFDEQVRHGIDERPRIIIKGYCKHYEKYTHSDPTYAQNLNQHLEAQGDLPDDEYVDDEEEEKEDDSMPMRGTKRLK